MGWKVIRTSRYRRKPTCAFCKGPESTNRTVEHKNSYGINSKDTWRLCVKCDLVVKHLLNQKILDLSRFDEDENARFHVAKVWVTRALGINFKYRHESPRPGEAGWHPGQPDDDEEGRRGRDAKSVRRIPVDPG